MGRPVVQYGRERITDEEIDQAWEEHLGEVSDVQDEQMLILDVSSQ